jgi:hypothetical protein
MSRRKGNGASSAADKTAISDPAIYYKTPVTPEEAFQAIGRLRREARDEIGRLIRFLDETDNHMEREPEDEADDSELEPSLGSFDRVVDQSKAWRQRGEFCSGNDAEQDDADAEPSLGSLGITTPTKSDGLLAAAATSSRTMAKPALPTRTA